jgi:hypothetical protein
MIRLLIAFWRVSRGHAQRIAAPGRWVVWRDGETVMSKILGKAN